MRNLKILLIILVILGTSFQLSAQINYNLDEQSIVELDYEPEYMEIYDEYLLMSEAGNLHIFNISDLENPEFENTLEGDIQIRGMQLIGDVLMVNTLENVEFYDLAIPDQPQSIAIYAIEDNMLFHLVEGNYLYFFTRNPATLHIVDIGDLAFMEEVGTAFIEIPGYYIVKEDLAIMSNRDREITIYDVSDPTQLIGLSSFEVGLESAGFDLNEDLLFVADLGFGFEIVDISDPSNPSIVTSYEVYVNQNIALGMADIQVYGDILLAYQPFEYTRVFDISDITNPLPCGWDYLWNHGGYSVASFPTLISAFYQGIKVFDASPALNCHFNVIEMTHARQEIFIDDVTVFEDQLTDGGSIGVQQGLTCVGSNAFMGEMPIHIDAWANTAWGLRGFYALVPISYQIWSEEHQAKFIGEAEYTEGNGLFAQGQTQHLTLTALEGPVLSSSHGRVHFGEVPIEELTEQRITLRNEGLEPLEVTNISIENEAVSLSLTEFSLEPGESIDMTIGFFPMEIQLLDEDITFESNVPLHPELALRVRGEASDGVQLFVSDNQHDFGEVLLGENVEWTTNLQNTGDEFVIIESITSDNPGFSVVPSQMILSPNESQPLTITFHPELDAWYTGAITVSVNSPDFVTRQIGLEGIGLENDLIIELQANYFELISFNTIPENLEVESVFNLENLAIVYDHTGGIYLPPIVDTIGEIQLNRGYQVFVRENSTLQVQGDPVDPQLEYDVSAGTWNWIGYPFSYRVPISTGLSAIEDQVVIVLTDDGGIWVPSLGVNTIGLMEPGEGYLIITNEDVQFQYTAETQLASNGLPETNLPYQSFDEVIPTGKPYAVIIQIAENLHKYQPSIIELYDGQTLVGKALFEDKNSTTPVVAWEGNVDYGLHGFTTGNYIGIRCLDSNGSVISEMITDFRFSENAYAFISLSESDLLSDHPAEFEIGAAFPNPFNATLQVPFALPKNSLIVVKLFNTLGQEVATISEEFPAGVHKLTLNADDLGSGIYFLQVATLEKELTQKVVLLR
ncbi:choice-of-anchor D domain-containing protein [bacterium]|nr:choice-of-anchor D domain-containing protein [bacterium]